MISLYMVSCLADVVFFLLVVFEGPEPGGNKTMVERVENYLRKEKVGNKIIESHRVSIHHPFGFNWHPFEGAG